MALCRVTCPKKGCGFAATMVRNPTTVCPKCSTPLQPIWDPPSLDSGNRHTRRARDRFKKKLLKLSAAQSSIDTPQDVQNTSDSQ